MRNFLFIILVFIFLGVGCSSVVQDINVEKSPQDDQIKNQGIAVGEFNPNAPAYTRVTISEIEGLKGPFNFIAEIPSTWLVEAVPEIESINIYDPNIGGVDTIDKSQIFIRYFQANDFLTLGTVNIFDRETGEANRRPIVTYDIEKKVGVADFGSQPGWRNKRHFVTDIRVSKSNPSLFYVFGRSPDLADEVFERFLASLEFPGDEKSVLVYPIDEFEKRITKKPFGIKIDPATSPVQPERFSGYHTGVDIEYGDVAGDVEVVAIADGEVVRSGVVSGYGGMVAIHHTIKGKNYVTIYGHLDSESLVSIGTKIKQGQRIGILGDAFSLQTAGERKHLHFSIHIGSDINVAGYVQSENLLRNLVNPLDFYIN